MLIGQVPLELTINITDRYRARHAEGRIAIGHDIGDFERIMLVVNLADDFFDNILERYNTQPRTILIDHAGKMFSVRAECRKLFIERCRFRHEPGLLRGATDHFTGDADFLLANQP